MFLILLAIGLLGLAVMALPAIGKHSALRSVHAARGALGHGHGLSRVAGVHALGSKAAMAAAASAQKASATRFLPSPRAVFSLLALYGAFGNLLEHAQVSALVAYFAAAVPAVLVERFAVTPLWNWLLGFQAPPCAPLDELVLSEAEAVTPFRNGKGLVSVVREGRRVQLAARITDAQAARRIEVGDRLTVEDVDATNERLTVSVREE